MTTPEDRIAALGLQLPAPIQLPSGMTLPFSFINVRGNRAMISGHPRQSAEGAISGPFGTLGMDMSTQEGYDAARDIALSALANLKAEIGALSRVKGGGTLAVIAQRGLLWKASALSRAAAIFESAWTDVLKSSGGAPAGVLRAAMVSKLREYGPRLPFEVTPALPTSLPVEARATRDRGPRLAACLRLW